LKSAREKMDVSVIKPRQDQAPSQINRLCLRPGQGADFLGAASHDNSIAAHRQRLGNRLAVIHGVNIAIQQD